jgi:hypothetical protein
MMIRLLATALLASTVAAPAEAAPQCKGSPKVVGDCMSMYGTLTIHDGKPSMRIWPAGTKKLYGVADTDGGNSVSVPEALKEALATNPREIKGKFEMCPLQQDVPNRLTLVCLEDATGLKAVPQE